ncbi:MAG TPA: hypothetical protein VFU13_10670 [Steroidobacteraceae bacterium]|nr:hypothetical protein [Steroidobacteraceae bacterium]
MRRVGAAVFVAVLCAIVAAWWWRNTSEHAQPADAGEPVPPSATIASADVPAVSQADSALRKPQDTPALVQGPDYAAQLRAAPDYLEFARSLLGAAHGGDPAAQFYIFRALQYCKDEYLTHVDRGNAGQSLEDALKWAATNWPYDPEFVRLIYNRCHTLIETGAKDIGERREWLQRASDGGYPLAQILVARQQWLERAGTADDDAARYEESRRLASMAIRSRDPAVIWEIADSIFKGVEVAGEFGDDVLAWFLAACQRGFDCSPKSDAVRAFCHYDRNCQPYESLADILRRTGGGDFPGNEARARQINEKIDAGDWEALGF